MFRICKIVVETVDAEHALKKYLGGYPVEITQEFDTEEMFFSIPTLIIGWNTTKNLFPDQKITNSKIVNNLSWTYNENESKESIDGNWYYKIIEDFVNKHLQAWLPSDYILYDSMVQVDINEFINKNINEKTVTYIHFNNGALYMRNDNRNFIINVKTLWLTESNYRDTLAELFNRMNCLIYSYNDIENYVNLDKLGNIRALDTIRWIKHGVETELKYFQIVPGIDISKYIPFLMSKIPIDTLELDEEEEVFFNRMCVREKIARWMSTRYISFSYDFKKKLKFIYRDTAKLAKIKYSTKRTITGRINNHDKYNVQGLSNNGNDRTMIISRFRGGRIYQFDYTSFEARIALYLSGDSDFIQDYYDKDLHSETARIIFETLEFTNEQRAIAKRANMAIMYGSSDETAIKILSAYTNPREKLRKIKIFLNPIFKKSKEIIDNVKLNGYFITKWGSIIKPEKDFAGFNNYLQSTAAEIMVDKVIEVKSLLNGMKSQFMFQVHDSLVFDIHPEETKLVEKIAELLSYNKGMLFAVNYKSGSNYKDLSKETTYF